jgi:hypothetical protein
MMRLELQRQFSLEFCYTHVRFAYDTHHPTIHSLAERQRTTGSIVHYGSQTRGRRPRAVGTASEAVGTGCADGRHRHKAVGL